MEGLNVVLVARREEALQQVAACIRKDFAVEARVEPLDLGHRTWGAGCWNWTTSSVSGCRSTTPAMRPSAPSWTWPSMTS